MNIDIAERFLLAGGNLIMNTRGRYSVQLAVAAANGGGHLTLVGFPGNDLLFEILQAGGRNVTFDIADYPSKG